MVVIVVVTRCNLSLRGVLGCFFCLFLHPLFGFFFRFLTGDDQDLAQLLADLGQGGGSPDDDSVLGSQATQEPVGTRGSRDGDGEELDEDARESLEMSQVWQDGGEEEDDETR